MRVVDPHGMMFARFSKRPSIQKGERGKKTLHIETIGGKEAGGEAVARSGNNTREIVN